jgi:hypothetical protein
LTLVSFFDRFGKDPSFYDSVSRTRELPANVWPVHQAYFRKELKSISKSVCVDVFVFNIQRKKLTAQQLQYQLKNGEFRNLDVCVKPRQTTFSVSVSFI